MEHCKTGPVALVSTAAVTAVAATVQAYGSNDMTLKQLEPYHPLLIRHNLSNRKSMQDVDELILLR